ncbi:LysR family transcriptional regulator [Jiella pacifica]|uniref:LysR family transcriptional regulator n=1 Tax=Jiella pacifica TaxID=2696469 RepID=A0A6N9T842_9HYPH|nr:LysR family transcriptional regulator [Jiella pacifica]NDW05899.1 LysR family transcriptional regulator [Jiella pacifica]
MNVRFSLRQLTYFLAVAERGSVRAAAEELNVSPTALTQALNELERELGTVLLHRQRAVGARLTQAGANLVGQVRTVLDSAADLQSLAERWELEPAGSLAVGCVSTLSPFLAARLLRGFQDAHPAIAVDLRDDRHETLLAELEEGRTELSIVYEHCLSDRFARDTLYRIRPHVVLPAAHWLAGRQAVSLHDLADEPFILYDAAPAGANTLGIFAHAGISPRIGRRTANFELVRSFVGAELGYSVLLHHPAADVTHDGAHVVWRPVAEQSRDFGVVLAWPLNVRLSRRAEAFRSHCRRELTDFETFLANPSRKGTEA